MLSLSSLSLSPSPLVDVLSLLGFPDCFMSEVTGKMGSEEDKVLLEGIEMDISPMVPVVVLPMIELATSETVVTVGMAVGILAARSSEPNVGANVASSEFDGLGVGVFVTSCEVLVGHRVGLGTVG